MKVWYVLSVSDSKKIIGNVTRCERKNGHMYEARNLVTGVNLGLFLFKRDAVAAIRGR